MVVLDEKQILSKCRVDNLSLVRNLNLWGSEIDDLSILKRLPNVEVLSLSMNNITTLKDFGFCTKLSELYLRKNKIADISEVRHLVLCTHLKVLWLSENPCAKSPNYRAYIISQLPQLVKLDNTDVTQEERKIIPSEKASGEAKDPYTPKGENQKISRRANSPSQQESMPSNQIDPSRRAPKSAESPSDRHDHQGRRMWQAQNPVRLSEVIRQAGEKEFTPEEKAGTIAPSQPAVPASRRAKIQVEAEEKPASISKQSNTVLSAILTLLNELDDTELTLLRERVVQKMTQNGG